MSSSPSLERERRILMIAYHFPPVKGSSGIQRTLKFSRYLPEFGWKPVILSANPRAYAQTSDEQLGEIPDDVPVKRAFALDTARHLQLFGRYPRFLALPDRWTSWWIGGVISGLRLIRKYKPAFIWSTYPIATAHKIAATLNRLTGVPWIADCRDSMTESHYPRDPVVRKSYIRIERRMTERSCRTVFTTPGTRAMYAERYPERPDNQWFVIPNGYDEENFAAVERRLASPNVPSRSPTSPGRIKLVHSGIIYPLERDPTRFFQAIATLKSTGVLTAETVEIVLRATGHDDLYRVTLAELAIDDIVALAPALPYADALTEMCTSDGLLLFQAANCNHQIPAKVYEYTRAGRPILALTDPAGDTAGVLRGLGYASIARLDSDEEIATALREFVDEIRLGGGFVAEREAVRQFSRREGARTLANLLDSLLAEERAGEMNE